MKAVLYFSIWFLQLGGTIYSYGLSGSMWEASILEKCALSYWELPGFSNFFSVVVLNVAADLDHSFLLTSAA